MDIVYTRHAKARMRWRRITKEEIARVLESPERFEVLSVGRYHYFRSVGRRYLRVTCSVEGGIRVIITVVDKSN